MQISISGDHSTAFLDASPRYLYECGLSPRYSHLNTIAKPKALTDEEIAVATATATVQAPPEAVIQIPPKSPK